MLRTHCFRLLALAVATGLSLAAANLQAAETLKLKQIPNATAKYEKEQKTDQVLTIAGMDVETSSSTFSITSYTSGERADDGSLSVTEKHDVLQTDMTIVGMKYQFDSANPDAEAPGGLEVFRDLLRVTFRTPVTTVYGKDGKVSEVKIPPESVADLNPIFADLFDPEKRKTAAEAVDKFLPKDPVNTGDQWESDVEAPLGGGQTMTFHMQYKLEGIVDEGGVKLRRISAKPTTVTYRMDPNAPSPLKVTESDLKITDAEGEFLFDAERGMIVREASKIVVGGTLKFVAGTQELPGKLALTLSSKTKLQPQ